MARTTLNVNFNLRDTQSITDTPVNMVIRYCNQKLIYPTNERIHPKHWQGDKSKKGYQRAKSTADFSEFNRSLEKIKHIAGEVYTQYKNDNNGEIPSPNKLKDLLDIALDRKSGPVRDLIPYIKQFIEQAKGRKNAKTGKSLAYPTIQKYKTTLKHIEDYIKDTGHKVSFAEIDIDFRSRYMDYLVANRGLCLNSVGKSLKTLKRFLNAATEAGINKYTKYKHHDFTAPSETADSIYLNWEEIDALADLDLANNPKLDKARDLFLISCYTGLRYADVVRLTVENNVVDGRIEIETQKTGEPVKIPIDPVVHQIMAKYNNSFPPAISNQKLNTYLKELGQKVESLKVKVAKRRTIGDKKETKQFEKWQLLTCHVGRRSFATNLIKTGEFTTHDVMRFTAHTKEDTLLKYVKITR
ncbi:MAG: hypothetical protein EOP48_08770, partial [Sphingobacteriales bacterium]